MKQYIISIVEYAVNEIYDPLCTFIIESDKTPEELKNEIIEHNNKRKDNRVKSVTVMEFASSSRIKRD